jgi:hypothetical protein
MNVILVQRKESKVSKLILAGAAIISIGLLVSGGITFNPILLGAGVAAIFLSCGGIVALRKPPQTYF